MGKIASLKDCFDIAERTYSHVSDYFGKGEKYCPTYSELKNWFENTPTLGLSIRNSSYKNNQLVQVSDIEKRDMNCYFWFNISNAWDYPNAKFSHIGISINGQYHDYDPNSYNPSYAFLLTGGTSYSVYSLTITYQPSGGQPITAGHTCTSGNMSGYVQPGQTIVVEFRIEY